MPSIFSLFGELGLKSNELEAGLKRADARLQATDANLNKVISTSNKLGDTSATVARRYEKLGEGIEAQRQRLIGTALAFEKGEINAKKFGSVIESVDKQVASLNSRLKDAAARATEIGETGATHFQNQIKGAVGGAEHSLFNLQSTRPFQGLGPVFQATGLRALGIDETIANILTVAVREAGILKTAPAPPSIPAPPPVPPGIAAAAAKYREMASAASETATATTAAAAAETTFSTAAKSAATSQAVVAAESEATAAAMTEASTVTTVFGASITVLAAGLAAAGVTIFASYKISKDILAAAEARLKTEEAIASAINKQNLALKEFQDRLKGEASNRGFDRFLKGDDIVGLEKARARLQQVHDENAKAISDELTRRAGLVDKLPILGAGYVTAAGETAAQAKTRKEQEDQISTLTAKIAELRQASVPLPTDFYEGIQKRQLEVFKEQQKQASDAAKKMAKKAVEDAKKFVEQVKNVKAAILDIAISTTDNPYEKIFDNARKAIDKLREAAKGLKIDLSVPIGQINAFAQNQAFKQHLSDQLGAYSLRSEARQLGQGFLDADTPGNFQKRLNEQLAAIGAVPNFPNLGSVYGAQVSAPFLDQLGKILTPELPKLSSAQQHIQDQDVISLIKLADVSKLTPQQRELGKDARDREAKRLEDQEKNSQELLAVEKEIATQLKVLNENGGLKLVIENNAPNNAKLSTRPKGTATTNYYSKAN